MTAAEYFEAARDCVRRLDRYASMIAAMRSRERVRAQRYDVGPRGKGGVRDFTAPTDSRIDMEARFEFERAGMEGEVSDARSLCSGVRAANPHHSIWGDALELRYIEDLPWRPVADALLVSESQARAEVRAALDWIDSVGIARAREGMGQASLF